MARRGEEGFHFSFGQLALLAVGVLASTAFVFFLGIYLGRESASQHAPLDERVARVPPPEPAPKVAKAAPAPAPPRAVEAPAAVTPPPVASVPTRRPDSEPPVGAVVPFTVQVLSTRQRAEAEQVRNRLVGKRIGAFVSEVEDAEGRWYRVRIGRYDDMAAATAMADRVKKELGFAAARVVPASADTGGR